MASEKVERNEDLAERLLQEIQADKEETKRLAILEQERLSVLREVSGSIQSLSILVGELSGKITNLASRHDSTDESLKELHRVFVGFIAYLNNELQQELQASRINQEGLGQLVEKLHKALTKSVTILKELGVEIEGPPGFDKFGGEKIAGLNKTEVLELLSDRFSDEELIIVCFNMGVDWEEDLEGETKLLKIASFIRFINRRRLASEFKRELMRMRPDINGFDVSKTQRFPTKPLGELPGNKEKEQ